MNTKEDPKHTALQKIEEIEEQVDKSPIMRALLDGGLSLIPVLGAAISSALSTRASNMAAENTKRLIQELRSLIERIDDAALDRTFLESDEFTVLLVRTLEFNARTHQQDKTKLFAEIFFSFLQGVGPSLPHKEDFLRIVDALDPIHIQALAIIYRGTLAKGGQQDGPPPATAAEVAGEIGVDEGRALAYCEQMIRYGLIRDWSIGRLGYKPGKYEITDYGKEFCQHLHVGRTR